MKVKRVSTDTRQDYSKKRMSTYVTERDGQLGSNDKNIESVDGIENLFKFP